MAASEESVSMAQIAARAASDKIASDIVVLDVSGQLVITDCFVVCSGDNERHVMSIADEIEDKLAEAGHKPVRREGSREARWVLLDYNDIVVHVQREPERDFYGLDSLWKDCPVIEIEGIELSQRGGFSDTSDAAHRADVIDDIPLAGREPDADEI